MIMQKNNCKHLCNSISNFAAATRANALFFVCVPFCVKQVLYVSFVSTKTKLGHGMSRIFSMVPKETKVNETIKEGRKQDKYK